MVCVCAGCFAGVDEVFLSLHNAQHKVKTVEDQHDLAQLTSLFHSPRFQNALAVHKAVVSVALKSPQPMPVCGACTNSSGSIQGAQDLHRELVTGLGMATTHHHQPHLQMATDELHRVLMSPHIKVGIYCANTSISIP